MMPYCEGKKWHLQLLFLRPMNVLRPHVGQRYYQQKDDERVQKYHLPPQGYDDLGLELL